jgi:hypothetical protein
LPEIRNPQSAMTSTPGASCIMKLHEERVSRWAGRARRHL